MQFNHTAIPYRDPLQLVSTRVNEIRSTGSFRSSTNIILQEISNSTSATENNRLMSYNSITESQTYNINEIASSNFGFPAPELAIETHIPLVRLESLSNELATTGSF
jgi:hypothetical protein